MNLNVPIFKVEMSSFHYILTTDLNVTSKQNFLIPPFCVVDMLQDTEGGFLLYSGADSHVRFSP